MLRVFSHVHSCLGGDVFPQPGDGNLVARAREDQADILLTVACSSVESE